MKRIQFIKPKVICTLVSLFSTPWRVSYLSFSSCQKNYMKFKRQEMFDVVWIVSCILLCNFFFSSTSYCVIWCSRCFWKVDFLHGQELHVPMQRIKWETWWVPNSNTFWGSPQDETWSVHFTTKTKEMGVFVCVNIFTIVVVLDHLLHVGTSWFSASLHLLLWQKSWTRISTFLISSGSP